MQIYHPFFFHISYGFLPLSTFPVEFVINVKLGLVRREEELDGGPGVLCHIGTHLVRVDLVHQQVVDLGPWVRAVCERRKEKSELFSSNCR